MRILRPAFVLSLVLVLPAMAPAAKPPEPALRRYQFGLITRGPAWTDSITPEIERAQAAHLGNIRGQLAAGGLAAAGPFADDRGLLGLFVFAVDSVQDVPAVLAGDEQLQSGRLSVALHTWYATPDLGRDFRDGLNRVPERPDSLVRFSFVLLKRGPAWTANTTPAVRRVLEGHMKNIDRLAKAGSLVLAGPFEGSGELRGVFVFDADSTTAARLAATDPAVQAGRFIAEVHPWWTWYGVIPGH